MLGPDATFRDGQREAIETIVEDRARVLVVQRTGWGKSLVYWIATRIRRDRGAGLTLVISHGGLRRRCPSSTSLRSVTLPS